MAANGPLRERLAGLGVELDIPPTRAVHRQRRDDRLGGALRPSDLRYPDYLALDVYASGERALAAA